MNLCTDSDDTGFVEVFQSLFTDVWNIAGDLFLTKLGITRYALEFLDVN